MLTVHSSPESETPRSSWMDGSATFTTVLSSMIMKRAKHMAASVHHLRLSSFRRMRSGMGRLRVLSGDAHRRDVLARDDGTEGLVEVGALLGGERADEVFDAGDTQLDEVIDERVRLRGRTNG